MLNTEALFACGAANQTQGLASAPLLTSPGLRCDFFLNSFNPQLVKSAGAQSKDTEDQVCVCTCVYMYLRT